MYKAPRGTVDILPADQPYWAHVQRRAADVCQLYGYERLELRSSRTMASSPEAMPAEPIWWRRRCMSSKSERSETDAAG